MRADADRGDLGPVQDIAGRRVTIPKRPERIISLAPSNTETLFALGLGGRVTGVDQSSDYPPAARDKPKIGTFSQPTIEAVVGLAPDLVLAANFHVRAAVRHWSRAGWSSS